jgi:hypothetical protein
MTGCRPCSPCTPKEYWVCQMHRSGVFRLIFIGLLWVTTMGREVSHTRGLTENRELGCGVSGGWIC